jgi:hypothetical protein
MRELARLATKAEFEQARIVAIREILDRGWGRPGPVIEEPKPITEPAPAANGHAPPIRLEDYKLARIPNGHE